MAMSKAATSTCAGAVQRPQFTSGPESGSECATMLPRNRGVRRGYDGLLGRLSCCLALMAIGLNAVVAGDSPLRPNIVFILADDLAWNDLGCAGGRVWETPALDGLARQGLRFTQAYAPAPICSASRAALLTGRSPARLHLEFVTKNAGAQVNAQGLPLKPPAFTVLPLGEVTFAEVLRDRGYRTGFFGKWHVAEHHGRYLGWSPTHGPQQQGFDEATEDFGGHPYAATGNLPLEGPAEVPAGRYPADSMTDKAIAFLERNRERPFCLMISHFYVHEPVRAPARWLFDKYHKKLGGGSAAEAAYGAFVETMDHHVGRVLTALDRLQLASNTVVIFTSDNGGAPGYGSLAPLRGCKWTLYEGGVRVPLLICWPGVIEPGRTTPLPVIGMDLFPTFSELAGAARPTQELDGRSLVKLLRTGSEADFAGREMLWHFPYYTPEPPKKGVRREVGLNPPGDTLFKPSSALRLGDWKIVHDYETGRDEVFDLTKDPGEAHNLAASEPAKARELRARLEQSLTAVNARRPERQEGSP